MPWCVGHGVAPATRPGLPAWGTIAIPCSAQSFTTCETSSTLPGRTTTAAVPLRVRRQSVTNGCLSASPSIRPLSPTMPRSAASTAGVTGAVGMSGVTIESGIFPRMLLPARLAAPPAPVIRGRPAQAVVDRKPQAGLRNGHDRDAGDARPVHGPQLGEEIGGRLGEISRGAEAGGQHGTCRDLGAER